MQQVIQNVRTGRLTVAHVPPPIVQPGEVLIRNICSVISAGTEKSVIDVASKSLLGKARERPDRVRQVLERVKTQGLRTTWQQVSDKLNEPIPLGYSSCGIVIACGAGVQHIKPGDHVASNGAHAGLVSVPKNLVAVVPDGVASEQAAFAVLSSIALQGVRLARVGLGDAVVVIGLGLIGQLTVRLLRLQGARVIGTDLDSAKCKLAMDAGAEAASPGLSTELVNELTRGIGADAVIVTAASKSDGPISLAANVVRSKGRVVAVGAVGLNLPRQPFYLKEAELVVSCSYGPGRYDPEYEIRGHDYPVGHVRWTEQRNMQAVLDLMGSGKLDVSSLITHRFPIDQAERAYEIIHSGSEPYLGMVLEYSDAAEEPCRPARVYRSVSSTGKLQVGCLGAGGFARAVLLPAMRQIPEFQPCAICSGHGLSAVNVADRLGFSSVVGHEGAILDDPAIHVVMILTRHDQHARQASAALRAGKHVFVEKPLAITLAELQSLEEAIESWGDRPPVLLVGFNRRFSPAARAVRNYFTNISGPRTISIRFNAGHVPPEHWTQDEHVGGGRIIGEACHGIDLATYLAGSPVQRVFAESVRQPHPAAITDDQCFITLRHWNGSISNIAYVASGDRSLPKERIEVFGGGSAAVIDDFVSAEVYTRGRRKRLWHGKQDKGHLAELQAFAACLRNGGEWPIPWTELWATTLASILAVRSLREGYPMDLAQDATANQQIYLSQAG